MESETHVLLLGHPTQADAMIRRALRRYWPDSHIHCAPEPVAAVGMLTRFSNRPWPIAPDVAILKVHEPDRMTARDISELRGHRILRHTVMAAFLEGERAGDFACVRGAGLTAVLTEGDFEARLHDLADAVVGNWLAPRDMDCSERYFCPQCSVCRVASHAGTGIPPVSRKPYLVLANDADTGPV